MPRRVGDGRRWRRQPRQQHHDDRRHLPQTRHCTSLQLKTRRRTGADTGEANSPSRPRRFWASVASVSEGFPLSVSSSVAPSDVTELIRPRHEDLHSLAQSPLSDGLGSHHDHAVAVDGWVAIGVGGVVGNPGGEIGRPPVFVVIDERRQGPRGKQSPRRSVGSARPRPSVRIWSAVVNAERSSVSPHGAIGRTVASRKFEGAVPLRTAVHEVRPPSSARTCSASVSAARSVCTPV